MRWLARGAAALLTLALLALLVLVLVPAERVAQLAADRIGRETGRAVRIEGPVRATLWPRLGVRADGVTVANAPWSEGGPLVSAATMEVSLGLGAVLGGDIRIDTLEIDGARILLERREDGLWNWETASAPDEPEPEAGPGDAGTDASARALSIDRAVLRNSEVTLIDRATGRELHLRALDLETRLDGLDAPVDVTASALVDDIAVELHAGAEAFAPLLDGALTPVTLALSGGGTSIFVDGRADLDPLSFEGEGELRSDDRFLLLATLGLVPRDLPPALSDVSVTAALTVAPAGTVHLRDIAAELGPNRLTGSLDLDPNGARPRLRADLAAESLDLASAQGRNEDGGDRVARPRGAGGWSTEPIDVSALHIADGEAALSTGPVAFDGGRIDELRLRAAVEEGRAVITLAPLLAYGGTVTGEVVVNGRGGLSARAALDVSGLRLQSLLAATAGIDRLVSTADLSVDLLGVGDSVQALMSGLEGTASIQTGPGEILGLDLVGMIRTLDLGYLGEGRETVFEGLSMSATVSGGVARSDDLVLVAPPYLAATGEGQADIGARTISYRLLPTLRAQQDGSGLTVPILLEGPWSDPTIRPDLEYIARERLDLERSEIEARARAEAEAVRTEAADELRQKLAEELEVAPEALTTPEGLEDAIRGRVQDQILELLQGR